MVSDPRTGFILGLANYPSFDLNQYNKLPADEQAGDAQHRGRRITSPVSVFKIVAISGAPRTRACDAATTFDCGLDKINTGE